MSAVSVVDPYELLNILENILDSDPHIDEVGFIHPSQFAAFDGESAIIPPSSTGDTLNVFDEINNPKSVETNSFANVFWNRDHKLGISTLNLFMLYGAARDVFLTSYKSYRLTSDPGEKIDEYSAAEIDVMKHSRALLLLSSDFGTAWNSRKMIVSKRYLRSSLMDELHLSALVLSYSPKSERAWSHRRWVIKMISKKDEDIQEIVGRESEFVKTIVENFKMNYRAWSYRCWLVSYMSITQLLHELQISREWAGLHVADNSCYHYRSCLLLKIIEKIHHGHASDLPPCFEIHQLWQGELDWVASLITRYVGRESLWLHRRFLSLIWMKHLANGDDQIAAPCNSCPDASDKRGNISRFVKDELMFFQKCSVVPDNDFEDYQAQKTHSTTYIAWLAKQIPEPFFVELEKSSQCETIKELLHQNGKGPLWESATASWSPRA